MTLSTTPVFPACLRTRTPRRAHVRAARLGAVLLAAGALASAPRANAEEAAPPPGTGNSSPAASAPAPAPDYRIDPARTELIVRTFKAGVAARLAHEHAIRAREVTGHLRFDPARPEEGQMSVRVQVGTLEVDALEARKRVGLLDAVGDGDRETIRENMLAEDQLWAAKYPTIEFVSQSFRHMSDNTFEVQGNFTLRGVTRPVRVQAVIEPGPGTSLRGVAKLSLKQSDFGFQPYRAMMGAIQNQDEVILHIDLLARR